jgi:hypothetical protein
MKHSVRMTVFLLALAGLAATATAEKMVSVNIGMTWPRALLATASPSGDAEAAYGLIIDKKLAFGIEGDFLWNSRSRDVVDSAGGGGAIHYRTLSGQKSFMFPIMGFFMLDPLPKMVVHPVAHFQIGYNSLIYSYTQDSSGVQKPLSPYFYGLIMKTGIDALYDIGGKSSLFIGMEYRWADMKTVGNTNGLFDKRDMGGIGLHAGFRVII